VTRLPADVCTEVKDIFSGFGQTKTLEDGFKVLRDAERIQAQKSISRTRRWSTLVQSKLLAHDCRNPVDIPVQGQRPAHSREYPKQLHQSSRNSDPGQAVPLTQILQRASWESLSAAQARGLVAEHAFLQAWHQRGQPEELNQWKLAFLREREVYMLPGNKFLLCLGTVGGKFACLAWPLEARYLPVPFAGASRGGDIATRPEQAGASSGGIAPCQNQAGASSGGVAPCQKQPLLWTLSFACVASREPIWVTALEADDLIAYPSQVASPANLKSLGLPFGGHGLALLQARGQVSEVHTDRQLHQH